MTGPVVGTVAVDVVPNVERWNEKTRAQIEPQAAKLGERIGDVMSKAMSDRIGAQLKDAIRKPVDEQTATLGPKGKQVGDRFGDAFGRSVRDRVEAALKNLPKANINADTAPADRQIELLRRKLALTGQAIKFGRIDDKQALEQIRVIQAQLDYLAKKSPDIRVRVDAGAASAELAKVRAELGLIGGQTDNLNGKLTKAGKVGFKPLMDPILLLGPALISTLAAIAAGIAAVGITAGAFAVGILGIRDEMKLGTPLGLQYAGMVGTLKNNFAELKETGAQTLLASFSAGFGSVQKLMPTLNNDVRIFGNYAGQIADHVLVGLIAGFHALNPLLEQIGQGLVRTSAKFQAYSSGNGLEAWAARVSADLPKITAAFGGLGHALGRLFEAAAGSSTAGLTVLSALSRIINSLPLPVLTALVSALLASRLAFLAVGVASKIAGSNIAKALGANSATSAEGLAGKLGKLAGVAALAATAYVALSTAGDSLVDSNNKTASAVGSTIRLVTDFGDTVKGAVGALTGNLDAAAAAIRRITDPHGLKADASEINFAFSDLSDTIKTQYNKTLADAQTVTDRFTNSVQYTQGLSALSTQLGDVTSKLQTQLDVQRTLDGVGQGASITVKGQAFNQAEYHKALVLTNGDVAKAVGILQANQVAASSTDEALQVLITRQTRVNTAIGQAQSAFKLTADQVDTYAAAIGVTGDALASGAVTADAFTKAIGSVVDKLKNASTSNAAWLDSVDKFTKAGTSAASVGELLAAALQAGRGYALDFATSNLTAATSVEKVASTIKANLKSISDNGTLLGQLVKVGNTWKIQQPQLSQGSLDVAAALTTQATAAQTMTAQTYQNEFATKGASRAANDALGVYLGYRNELIRQAEQSGLSKKAAKGLADQYLAVPKDVKTFFKHIGDKDVAGAIADLTAALNNFSRIIAKATVGLNNAGPTNDALDSIIGKIGQINSTPIKNPGSPNTGPDVSIPGVTNANGNLFKAYATGGVENHIPQIAKTSPGTVRVWAEPETQGEAYIPLANDSRRPRAQAIARQTVAMLGGIAAFATGGLTKAQQASLNQQRANIRFRIDSSDFDRLVRALTGSTASLASATRTLLADVHTAETKGLGSGSLVSTIARENGLLLYESKRRTDVASRLKDANTKLADAQKLYNDEVAQVRQTTLASVNLTSIGQQSNGIATISTVLASLNQRAKAAITFAAQLASLRRRGLGASALRELGEAGPDQGGTTVAALAGATGSQLKQFNRLFGQVGAAGTSAGTTVANTLYGAGVNAAKGLVRGLRSQEAALDAQMKRLADVMVNQIKRQLKIASPSQVFHELGQFIGQGLVNGISSHEDTVRNAASSLVGVATPNARAGGGPVPIVYVTAMLDGEVIDHRADVRIEHHNAAETRALLAGRVL